MASSVILHTTPLAQERRPSGAASLPRSLFWDIARPSKLSHPAWGSTRRRFSCSAMSDPCRGFLCGGVAMLKEVYLNCAGLDVHKKFVTACRLTVDAQGVTHTERRKYSTMTEDLQALATWLSAGRCTHVAMERTGVYWQPIYNILEGRFELFVVNAQAIKRMPGRKTDMTDAEWIATLMQHGLLQRSFIPDRLQSELRELSRYRLRLLQERTRFANRIQKVLEGTNIKLSAVVSDLQGV